MENSKKTIHDYWTKRSQGFYELRYKELNSYMADRWKNELLKNIPQSKSLKILDVGCGCGFFSILLDKMGHSVTAIDITEAMIEKGKELNDYYNCNVSFFTMDAESPDFEEETFDCIVSRNLTWTLPNPENAYKNWIKILKKDGFIVNFDANYGKANFSNEKENLPKNHAHNNIDKKLLAECDAINSTLMLKEKNRPMWDIEILKKHGCKEIFVDNDVSSRVYDNFDEFYNPTPMFCIKAMKG